MSRLFSSPSARLILSQADPFSLRFVLSLSCFSLPSAFSFPLPVIRKLLSPSLHGHFYFAADSAQVISAGSSFNYSDLTSHFYEEEQHDALKNNRTDRRPGSYQVSLNPSYFSSFSSLVLTISPPSFVYSAHSELPFSRWNLRDHRRDRLSPRQAL